jgi:hypothetical protein
LSRRLGSVEAIIVDTVRRGPGQMAGLRMGDLADTSGSILDTVTGGQYSVVSDKLDTISLGLKLSIAASVLSGVLATVTLFGLAHRGAARTNPGPRRRRRRRAF